MKAIQDRVSKDRFFLTPFMLPYYMKVGTGDKMAYGFRHDVVILCAELGLYRAADCPTELL